MYKLGNGQAGSGATISSGEMPTSRATQGTTSASCFGARKVEQSPDVDRACNEPGLDSAASGLSDLPSINTDTQYTMSVSGESCPAAGRVGEQPFQNLLTGTDPASATSSIDGSETSESENENEGWPTNKKLRVLINDSDMALPEKQSLILRIIQGNNHSDENFLSQIPKTLWNDDIIFEACRDDAQSIKWYFKDCLDSEVIDLTLIEKMIEAFGARCQREKLCWLTALFIELANVDDQRNYEEQFEIPSTIWLSGCKYCPYIVRYLPDRYLTRDYLELAKSAGVITFNAARFPDATAEDLCLFCGDFDLYKKDARNRYDDARYMKNIIEMKTRGLEIKENPFSKVEESYFTRAERPVGRMSLTNRALPALLFKCFEKSGTFRPPILEVGEALSGSIQTACNTFNSKPGIPTVSSGFFLPEEGGLNFYGNRSVMVKKDQGFVLFCQFLRDGESIDDLVREKSVHNFFAYTNIYLDEANHASLLQKLKTKPPHPEGILKISKDCSIAEKIISQCQDTLHLQQSEEGHKYLVFYYCSSKSENHSKSATAANTAQDRARAEQGIMNTAHDLGLWASTGVFHNSIVPLFSCYGANRSDYSRAWEIFPDSDNREICNGYCSLPKKLQGWEADIQTADISINGLRGWGDFVVFNKHAENPQKEIMDLFKNAGKNFIALTLVWCKLHLHSLDEKEVKHFLDAMFVQFTEGYFQSSSNMENPRRLVDLSRETYDKSLTIAAREIVFWLTHQQGTLSEAGELYPGENHRFSQGENLGVDEGLFPFTVLTKIITRLCTGIVDASGGG